MKKLRIAKKRIIYGAIALTLVAIVATPSILLWNSHKEASKEDEATALQLAFVQRYGPEAELIQITKPKDIYVYYWQGSEEVHATLWIDGLWIEVATISLPEQSTEE